MIEDYEFDWDEKISVELEDHVVFHWGDSELFWPDILE